MDILSLTSVILFFDGNQAYNTSKKSLKIQKWGNHDQKKKDKRTNNDLQTLHIKLKIEKHESHLKPGVKLGALEWKSIPAPLVPPVVLL